MDVEVKQCVPVDVAKVARDVDHLFHAPIQTANALLTVGEMPVALGDLTQLVHSLSRAVSEVFSALHFNCVHSRHPMKLEPFGNSRTAKIVLVDDNQDEFFPTPEDFDAASLRVNLQHADNGEKCLQHLRKQGGYPDAYTPDLILLDMHMPVMDGYAVLSGTFKNEKLRQLPMVELTTSYEEADICRMHELRCNSYTPEPVDFDNFLKTNIQLTGYRQTLVAMPCGSHPRARISP